MYHETPTVRKPGNNVIKFLVFRLTEHDMELFWKRTEDRAPSVAYRLARAFETSVFDSCYWGLDFIIACFDQGLIIKLVTRRSQPLFVSGNRSATNDHLLFRNPSSSAIHKMFGRLKDSLNLDHHTLDDDRERCFFRSCAQVDMDALSPSLLDCDFGRQK